jgi:hypothetical protein
VRLGRECAGGHDRRIVHQRRQFRFRAFLRHAWLHAAQQEEKRAPAGVAGPAIGQKDVRFRQRAEPGITGLKLKSGGSTPTTVRGRPSMVMDCPTIAGSASSDVRHSRSLTIALRSSSGAAAPVRNARPRAGLTPSVAKKFGLTSSAAPAAARRVR